MQRVMLIKWGSSILGLIAISNEWDAINLLQLQSVLLLPFLSDPSKPLHGTVSYFVT
jgi:hypothetical protein